VADELLTSKSVAGGVSWVDGGFVTAGLLVTAKDGRQSAGATS